MNILPTDLLGLIDRQLAASQQVALRYSDVEKQCNPKKAIESGNWGWILEYTRDDKNYYQGLYEKAYAKSCQLGDMKLMTIFESKIADKEKLDAITFKYLAKGSQIKLLDSLIASRGGIGETDVGFIYEGLVIANEFDIIKSRKYTALFDGSSEPTRIYFPINRGMSYRLGKYNRDSMVEFIKQNEPRMRLCPHFYYIGKTKAGHPLDEEMFSNYLNILARDYKTDFFGGCAANRLVLQEIGKNPAYHGICEQKILTDHIFAKQYFIGLLKGEWYQKFDTILKSHLDLVSLALEASIDMQDLVIFSKYFDRSYSKHCVDYCVREKIRGDIFELVMSLAMVQETITKGFLEHLIACDDVESFIKYFDDRVYTSKDAILEASKKRSPLILQWLFDNYPISTIFDQKNDMRPVCDVGVAKILVAQIKKGLQIVNFKKWIECSDFYDHDDVVAILKTAL